MKGKPTASPASVLFGRFQIVNLAEHFTDDPDFARHFFSTSSEYLGNLSFLKKHITFIVPLLNNYPNHAELAEILLQHFSDGSKQSSAFFLLEYLGLDFLSRMSVIQRIVDQKLHARFETFGEFVKATFLLPGADAAAVCQNEGVARYLCSNMRFVHLFSHPSKEIFDVLTRLATPPFLLDIVVRDANDILALRACKRLCGDRDFCKRIFAIQPSGALKADVTWVIPSLTCSSSVIQTFVMDLIRLLWPVDSSIFDDWQSISRELFSDITAFLKVLGPSLLTMVRKEGGGIRILLMS
jgi:hypothetical protein